MQLPPGCRLEWTGSFENQQRAVRRLEVVVPITLLAIFFLLFTAFDSGRFAMLILKRPIRVVGEFDLGRREEALLYSGAAVGASRPFAFGEPTWLVDRSAPPARAPRHFHAPPAAPMALPAGGAR